MLLRAGAGLAISVVACVIVVGTVDLPQVLAGIARADLRVLAIPVALVLVQLLVRAARWAGLLGAITNRPIRTRDAAPPLAVGYLGNIVLPARLGEVVRIILAARTLAVPAADSTASVVVERGVDLLALLAVAGCAYAMLGRRTGSRSVLVLGAILALTVALRAARWLGPRLSRGCLHAWPLSTSSSAPLVAWATERCSGVRPQRACVADGRGTDVGLRPGRRRSPVARRGARHRLRGCHRCRHPCRRRPRRHLRAWGADRCRPGWDQRRPCPPDHVGRPCRGGCPAVAGRTPALASIGVEGLSPLRTTEAPQQS